MPENAAYFHAAYVIAAVVYASYGVSLVWRRRAAERRRDGARPSAGP